MLAPGRRRVAPGRDSMPGKHGTPGDMPRTDLPPKKIPYDDDYFGSGEEEGVTREREASGEDEEDEDDGPRAA
jgi:hypothetical protein